MYCNFNNQSYQAALLSCSRLLFVFPSGVHALCLIMFTELRNIRELVLAENHTHIQAHTHRHKCLLQVFQDVKRSKWFIWCQSGKKRWSELCVNRNWYCWYQMMNEAIKDIHLVVNYWLKNNYNIPWQSPPDSHPVVCTYGYISLDSWDQMCLTPQSWYSVNNMFLVSPATLACL